MENKSKVGIVYLIYSDEPHKYLADAIEGVVVQNYPKNLMELIVIYNGLRADEPSMEEYTRIELEKNKDRLPHTTFLPQKTNLGFSGGNNVATKVAIEMGVDYIFLHNADAYMGPDCLRIMAEGLDKDKTIGTAQPLILLHPETNLINTAGNAFHYLGFGYGNEYRKDKNNVTLPDVKDVGYVSGAGTMMRADLLKQYGLWDEDFFMYHEDTDYSLRLRYMGYRTVIMSRAEFFHKYQFKKSTGKYFWMERNRYAILLIYFRIPTLILLFPAFVISELGLNLLSWRGGWWPERKKAYQYWMKKESWKLWLKKRAFIQKNRKIRDRDMFKYSVGGIYFQEEGMHGRIHTIANCGMEIYYYLIVRTLIWW